MVKFGTHFPSGELSGVSLSLEIIGSTVKPMLVTIDMEVIKVFKLIERMMLEIVRLYKLNAKILTDLFIFSGLRFILESSSILNLSGLEISLDLTK